MGHTIRITQKNVYGQSKNYPACKMSELFCEIANMRTLPDRMIRDIQDSGLFDGEVVAPTPTPWRRS